MQAFFDTSAVVPLLLQEPHTDAALAVWNKTEGAWAWRWMQVETEAALARRKASRASWRNWRELALCFRWLELESKAYSHLCTFNRAMGLRAADAGHLYVYERSTEAIPSMTLVTFDLEMQDAAHARGMELYLYN